MSNIDSREIAETIEWMEDDFQHRRFYWLLITDAYLPITKYISVESNFIRMQYHRPYDFIGIAEVITRRELRLFNMNNPGDKELWFMVTMQTKDVIWISSHDCTDEKTEVCISCRS